ncbi:MAG TPA: SOS response-associated peptidase family protein [Terriglobia bacterium]|nr:SOS response-associated peptidase family protein [Terriglobia bacterium]
MESCTILTTAPNSLMADLHDRMPLILPAESYDDWLTAPASEASSLLLPYNAVVMRRCEVSSLVNSPKNDSPECIVPVVA